jgi:hypothetical protein
MKYQSIFFKKRWGSSSVDAVLEVVGDVPYERLVL